MQALGYIANASLKVQCSAPPSLHRT